eukprot:670802-Prymnesium_polylepis.1
MLGLAERRMGANVLTAMHGETTVWTDAMHDAISARSGCEPTLPPCEVFTAEAGCWRRRRRAGCARVEQVWPRG